METRIPLPETTTSPILPTCWENYLNGNPLIDTVLCCGFASHLLGKLFEWKPELSPVEVKVAQLPTCWENYLNGNPRFLQVSSFSSDALPTCWENYLNGNLKGCWLNRFNNQNPSHLLGKLFEWKLLEKPQGSLRPRPRLPTCWENYLNGNNIRLPIWVWLRAMASHLLGKLFEWKLGVS